MIISKVHLRSAVQIFAYFQDNNYSQYEIIKMLGAHGNVMVVGDDDQLIMRFQGARQENFDDFRADVSKVKSKTLGENYRCTQPIVNVSELVLKVFPRKD